MSSIFENLNNINVNNHTEKKENLTYLSWAWAWAELKKLYPKSFFTIYENENGWNYFTDGKTCWVKTGVTVVDGEYELEHIEYLPIMDFKNKSIALENVTSTDVNKTIQRSLTKAAARHGLGLYIYAGEDLPEADIPEEDKKAKAKAEKAIQHYNNDPVTAEMIGEIQAELTRTGVALADILKVYKVESIEKLTQLQYENCISRLKKSKSKGE